MSEHGRELKALLLDTATKPQRVADLLDALSHDDRVAAVRSLGSKHLHRMWDLVDGFGELTLDYYVPKGTPPLTPVPHYGKNSLPAFTIFEKRFYILDETELGGANFNSIMGLVGPGYYVASEDKNRRELTIDYRRIPDKKPEGWPAIKQNTSGISTFVYGHMIDTTRRVSAHVSIGGAMKHGKDVGARFVLCRQG